MKFEPAGQSIAGRIPHAKCAAIYWFLGHRAARPAFLHMATALVEAGGLTDQPRGWKLYAQYLAWQAAAGPAGQSEAYASLSRGWALGSDTFKARLVEDHAVLATSRAWETTGKREIQQLQWNTLVLQCLDALGQSSDTAEQDRKSAPWKIAVAAYLKQRTQAGNAWLGARLHLGSANAVSHYLSLQRRNPAACQPFLHLLTTRIGTFSERSSSSVD